MPWKGEKDPYRIWLSEIILQQTRVEQGLAYYLKFIEAFPTVHALAGADDELVFKMWEGLGYYRRCRNLLATARLISTSYDGRFPDRYDEILKLQGVGAYTAAAIASFAYDEPRPVVDGNVQRVMARFFGVHAPIDSAVGRKRINELAEQCIDRHQPAAYNQAIMDFGAMVCKPAIPACNACPLSIDCYAFAHGEVKTLPVKQPARPRRRRWFYYFIVRKANEAYIRKRAGNDIWQDLHEFILCEKEKEAADVVELTRQLIPQGAQYRIYQVSRLYRQQLTHQQIFGRFVTVDLLNSGGREMFPGYHLASSSQLASTAFPRIINDFIEAEGSPL